MAEFLNNIVNNNPIPQTSDLVNQFNIPSIPKIGEQLNSLSGKLPNKELADKAASKLKEIQDKFKGLKKTKNSIRKPKPLKLKEVPVPKKFKKAELEKFKGLSNFQNLKEKVQGVASQAQGLSSQAQGLASQAQSVGQGALSKISNISSQAQSAAQNALTQITKNK